MVLCGTGLGSAASLRGPAEWRRGVLANSQPVKSKKMVMTILVKRAVRLSSVYPEFIEGSKPGVRLFEKSQDARHCKPQELHEVKLCSL